MTAKPLATEIAIRVYTEKPRKELGDAKRRRQSIGPSEWTVVFDCETTVDEAQALRFGFYQVRKLGRIDEEGAFYNSATLSPGEVSRLRAYAYARDLKVRNVEEFRRHVLLGIAYKFHATVIGFNLPFDLSRIAMSHSPARRSMRDGFSFQLDPSRHEPRIRVKHLSPRSALIDFARPWKQQTPRGMRKRRLKVAAYAGHFVDIKTLGSALLSGRFSLKTLAEALGTKSRKIDTDEHGRMTAKYLDYARADVQVTWECYQALLARFARHRLLTSPDRLLSEASIGKGYLQMMGVKPLLECDPTFPRERFGEMFGAYYGGRAEVRIRRVPCEVLYCDFKSMYPTVNALMGLWKFVIGHGMSAHDTTSETQALLESISLEDLCRSITWRNLCTLVRLVPQGEILPVRSRYHGQTFAIGLNQLTASEPLWFTLADCILSKLLTGKCPQIDRATTYRPGPPQKGLTSISILNRESFAVDPIVDDFFTRLIDMRDDAKSRGDAQEKALKIIANSTSYGIFIEVNRDDAPKGEALTIYGPSGEHLDVETRAIENPGRYFNPLLGVLITGAARLMLGIAEKLTLDYDLDWAYCDTDSIAIARPIGMARREFHKRARLVIDWFRPLNPYRKSGSILKVEDENYGIASGKLEPLYCFAISAKRNALFNRRGSQIIIRKASAHGLGHLLDPYANTDAPPRIPPPLVPLNEIGVRRWQHDLWYKIIQAALTWHPDSVSLDWHPGLRKPAAIRYTASSPQLLSWLAKWNRDRPYESQIRPFGFLLSFMSRKGPYASSTETLVIDSRRGRPADAGYPAPIAPYASDPARAFSHVFDRISGNPVPTESLKTYAEAIAQYHLSSEDKFENGQFLDRGRTERRHVVATGFIWIGKEANRVGESGEADPVRSAVQEFTSTPLAESDLTSNEPVDEVFVDAIA